MLKEFCMVEIQTLIAEHNVHIDSNADKIVKTAEKICAVKSAFKNFLVDAQKPAKLVNITNDQL